MTTREQVEKWDAKLSNGFKLDRQMLTIWNRKEPRLIVKETEDTFYTLKLGWDERYERFTNEYGCTYNRRIEGYELRIRVQLWKDEGAICSSRGLGQTINTGIISDKRMFSKLADFTKQITPEKARELIDRSDTRDHSLTGQAKSINF